MSDFDVRMAELRARLLVRCRDEHRAIEDAMRAEDRNTLIDRSHKLAGIAGMLGAPEIGEAALELEDALRAERSYHAEATLLLHRLTTVTA